MDRKRVLIIRLSSLGDVIFNLPLASVLKKAGYYVAWVTGEKGIDIVRDNPLVDEAIFIPTQKWKSQSFFKTIKDYLKILKYIRSKNFDIVIDTQLLFKSFVWTVFSGGKRRLVSKSAREFSILGGNEFVEKLSFDFNNHAINNYLKYAKYLNLDTQNYKVKLPLSPPESKVKIDTFLLGLDKNKPLIVICPATTWVTKHWDRDNWKVLIKLIEKDFNLVFTGETKDFNMINYISSAKHLNLAGLTNVLDLIELFRRTDLVISLDNGSTHLAWATQHPKILSIFCSTPESMYAPIGSSEKYISISASLRCRPCHKRICPLKSNKNCCTMRPTVHEVYEKVQELLPVRNNRY